MGTEKNAIGKQDKWAKINLIEKTRPPYPLYFVKPHFVQETSPGHFKQDPAIKIEWKENAHGEYVFDIDDYCSKEAYTRSMQGLCPMSDTGRKTEAKKLRQEIINKLERLPEWETGIIQPYVPHEEKQFEKDVKYFAERYNVTEADARKQLLSLKEEKENPKEEVTDDGNDTD